MTDPRDGSDIVEHVHHGPADGGYAEFVAALDPDVTVEGFGPDDRALSLSESLDLVPRFLDQATLPKRPRRTPPNPIVLPDDTLFAE